MIAGEVTGDFVVVDDDDFQDYNPHPYSGGYDIAATYGDPLPPSPSTCYPISSPNLAVIVADPPKDNPVESAADLSDFRRPTEVDSYYNDPLGFWPLTKFGVKEQPYWAPWKRAAEWLFGYSQGYGDRRIGVDSLGIPIYASKKGGLEDPLSLQIEPAKDVNLHYFEWSSNSHSFHPEDEHDTIYEHTYPRKDEFICWNGSYDPSHEVIELKNHSYANTACAYERHYPEGPLNLFLQPIEHGWSNNPLEMPEQLTPSEFSWYSAPHAEDNHVYTNTSYAYQSNYHERPSGMLFESIEEGWMDNIIQFEVTEQLAPSESRQHFYENSAAEYGQGNLLDFEPFPLTWSKCQDYENGFDERPEEKHPTSSYGQGDSVELEPYEPSWTRNLSYYELFYRAAPSTPIMDEENEQSYFPF